MAIFGRREIFTDVEAITSNNVIEILRDAITTHTINKDRCEFLLNYEAGYQPLLREKTYRPDINVEDNDNVANEVTEFKLGFVWGNPITVVQDGDSKKKNISKAISMLNKFYNVQGINKKSQELGRYVEICGIGYTYVEINTDTNAKAPFRVEVLDPRYTFVVKSSRYVDHRVMMGVTYRQDSLGNYYFTCITNHQRFEVENIVKIINGNVEETDDIWRERSRSGEINPLGIVSVIEWERSADRLGCFERQISEMNALNLAISDFGNDIDQNTQAIWHGNDIEFPVDEEGNQVNPRSNDWLLTRTTSEGKTPFVKPLSVNYEYAGMLNFIINKRSLILQKCAVPQRNDNSGGSTGIAMSDATGWSSAEASASKQQAFQEYSKMKELEAVLRAIDVSPFVKENDQIRNIDLIDIQPNIKRQKTYELTVKTNAIATLLAKGFALEDAISIAPLFADPNVVIERSGEGVKKYQETEVFKENEQQSEEKRPFADYSDQIDNSPNING